MLRGQLNTYLPLEHLKSMKIIMAAVSGQSFFLLNFISCLIPLKFGLIFDDIFQIKYDLNLVQGQHPGEPFKADTKSLQLIEVNIRFIGPDFRDR